MATNGRFIAAAAAALALLAASCAADPEPRPQTQTAADAAVTTEAPRTENRSETDTATTTTVVQAGGRTSTLTTSTSAAALSDGQTEQADDTVPVSESMLEDCIDWATDTDAVLDEQQTEECVDKSWAAANACEGADCPNGDTPEPEPTTTTAAPETTQTTTPPEPEPTITTAAPEPEPPVVSVGAPSLVVDPVVVREGLNTFTIKGSGFDPSLRIGVLLCALPGGSLSADTAAEEIADAIASVERSDCDLSTVWPVDVDSDGSFTIERDAIVAANFLWVASDAAEIQTAGAAVFLETQAPEPVAATARVADPLTRCIPSGMYMHGRVSVMVGRNGVGHYEAVAQGEADSCEIIKQWWDGITAAEAERIAAGQYPCEYRHGLFNDELWNGPPLLAGCWPRIWIVGNSRPADAGELAELLNRKEFGSTLPPNHPALVDALYDCYQKALEGPPVGWSSPDGAHWYTVVVCTAHMRTLGNAVRYLGVDPVCAAEQYRGRVEEFPDSYPLKRTAYSGSHSWGHCSTWVSRVLLDGMDDASYTERCETVVDKSVIPATDQIAQDWGITRAELVATLKATYCTDGTESTLRASELFNGDAIAETLPQEESVCWEPAMLAAAWRHTRNEVFNAQLC
ncbi:MAG: hypothetical protein F4Z34_08385 [Acidimicrobiaceae bacterium]|nr:hypothetical protein [Acidimicrobiaceae bacterium]